MKKLICMAILATISSVASAASITWSSAKIYAAIGKTDLSFESAETTVGTSASVYMWFVDATTFANTSVDSIYNSYSKQTTSADVNTTTVGSKISVKTEGLAAGDTRNALILVVAEADDGTEIYFANKASATIGQMSGSAVDANVSKLDSKVGGAGGNSFTGAGTAIEAWTAVSSEETPEPTSGLLLLVGMAGLALKRKRA